MGGSGTLTIRTRREGGTAIVEIGDTGPPRQLGAAQDTARVGRQDFVHGPLLRRQMLEGVRIRQGSVGNTMIGVADGPSPVWIRRSGPCHDFIGAVRDVVAVRSV